MANNMMPFDSDGWALFFSSDGSTFTELTGIAGFSIATEAGTSRTLRTLKESTSVTQQEGPGQMTIDVGNFLPHLRQWKSLRAHKRAGDVLTFRAQSRAEQTLDAADATRLIAIDATGVATLSGAGQQDAETDLAVGNVLDVTGEATPFTIESIIDTDSFRVDPKTAVAVAAQYAVKIPQARLDVRGKVLTMNTENLSEGAQLANAITIALRAIPGDWSTV